MKNNDFYCGTGGGESWLQTYSGLKFFPENPTPDMIDLKDIAHALAFSCRYNGQCKMFYSVAEHSVYVSRMVPEEHALAALLHDAAEAYVGDIVRGVKHLVHGFSEMEDKILSMILMKYGCHPVLDPCIKKADNEILYWEKEVLMPGHFEWNIPKPEQRVEIYCWQPDVAEDVFMERFHELRIFSVKEAA